jgi:hypothetical protein
MRALVCSVVLVLSACGHDGGGSSDDGTGGAPATGGAVTGGGVPEAGGMAQNASGAGGVPGMGGAVGAGGNLVGAGGTTTAAGGTMTAAGGFGGRGGRGNRGGAGGAAAGAGGASTGGATTGGAAGAGGACTQDLACKPTAPSTGDMYADCVARVNQFRACACLPPLAHWTDGEACANQDATYDAQNQSAGAHAGFKANICAAGNAQDECPGWRSNDQVVSGCLQQMFDEGPPPMNPCTGTCYEQHGHFINMTNTRYTQVACGFFTNTDGKIWGVQNFK